MLELRLLLVGLFDGLGALLLGLRGFRGRAVRGVALCDGGGCVVSCGGGAFWVCVWGQLAAAGLRRRGFGLSPAAGRLGRPRRWRRCGASLRRCAAAGEGRGAAARSVLLAGSEHGAGGFTRSARPPRRRHSCERRCESYQNGRHVSVVRLSSAQLRLSCNDLG